MEDMKLFPIHPDSRKNDLCPRAVPWGMVEQFEWRSQHNHSQTLQRLAERGGLDIVELYLLLHDKDLIFDKSLTFNIALSYVLMEVSNYLKKESTRG